MKITARCILGTAFAGPQSIHSGGTVKAVKHPPKLGELLDQTKSWCEVGGPPSDCLCFKPLPCPAEGCRTYDQEAGRLEKLLKAKPSAFPCTEAEEGGCATWRYIYCDGGRGESHLKLYDEAGRLRAERKISRTKEFCGGKALIVYEGEVVACQPLQRVKQLHGKGEVPKAEAEDYPFAPKPK